MNIVFFSSARMILLECHESPAVKLTSCTPPDHRHSTILNRLLWERSAQAYRDMGLGAISDVTICQPPLPPYRVGNSSTIH